jgi:hypothetical protein
VVQPLVNQRLLNAVCVFRRDSLGAWQYWVESDERLAIALLDDEDREGLQPQAMSATVSSLQEALRLLDRYPWHMLSPLVLHPDCREMILKAIEDRGGSNCPERWEEQAILRIQRR